MKICTIDDCQKPLRARGMCATHWSRWKRRGDPRQVIGYAERRIPLDKRFWSKVDKSGPCWTWTGALSTGYGVINVGDGKLAYAHRIAYEWLIGPIGDGMTVDHLCRNTACCNPAHLEAVPLSENIRRAARIGHFNAPKTCRRGHDWSIYPPLLAHRSDGRVTRQCRVCAESRGAA